jgi:imidazolonepropionase-like amidohydrolase
VNTVYLLKAGLLLTGKLNDVLQNAAVMVDGDKIVEIGRQEELAAPSGAAVEIIDLQHMALMPGMIDCHVHLGFDASADPVSRMKEDSDQQLLLRMGHNARKLLQAGVTTARDMGARGYLDIAIKEAIEGGYAEGPHLLVSNRPITTTGGHCWFMGCECDDRISVRKAAREHLKAGADWIKIMASGGMMTRGSAPFVCQYDAIELQAASDEAHRVGKKIASHAHSLEGIRNSVEAGVDTIEHCSWMTRDGYRFDERTAELICEKGIYVCSTISAAWKRYRSVMEQRHHVVRRMREIGLKFVAGTDAGIDLVPFEAYVDGLEMMSELGMTNGEIIEAATLLAADACGVLHTTGTLDVGKRADIIAVQGNPVDDLGALRKIALVMKSGKIFMMNAWQQGKAS